VLLKYSLKAKVVKRRSRRQGGERARGGESKARIKGGEEAEEERRRSHQGEDGRMAKKQWAACRRSGTGCYV